LGSTGAEAAGLFGFARWACRSVLTLPVIAGGGPLGDGCSGWTTGAVEVVFFTLAVAVVAGANPTPKRLGIVETIGLITEIATTTHAGPGRGFLVVVEVGRAAGLLRRHATQPNALVAEEDGGSGQQELTELEDRIKAPALKKENAAAEKPNGGKKHVVVARQSRLEAPHEVEESPADGQHDPDNAGPIQAGVNHRSICPFRSL
jgi:hypothetical protein